ncbi:carbohydrate-selective porin B [Ameyamaea chiangmaiensis NBRC 103196]|nr:carbohydrate-selective porin B [Ameyamaea chiangmaiensis NBRC 103196]
MKGRRIARPGRMCPDATAGRLTDAIHNARNRPVLLKPFRPTSRPGRTAWRWLGLALIVLSLAASPSIRTARAQATPGVTNDLGTQPSMRVNARRSSIPTSAADQFSAPYGNDHLLGDWGGVQPWLVDHGIHLAVDVLEQLSGNATGGRQRTQTNAGQVGVELDLDWGKIAGAKNLWSHMMIVNGHGRSLSSQFGDNLGAVQQIYGARGNVVAHLVYAYLEQSLIRNHVDLSVGWIPVGSFFAASPLFCDFMNVVLCGNPAPGKYVPGGRDWPSGNLGAVLRVMPRNDVYLMAGLFAVSPHSFNGGISGWSWAQSGMGKLSTPLELGWVPEFGPHHLAGHYKAGFGYDNSHYDDIFQDINGNAWVRSGLPARTHAGRYTAWIQGDQMLMRNGDGATNGLIALGGYMHISGDTVAMSHHAWLGMIETGAHWGRPLDIIGISWNWLQMSRSSILQQEASVATGQPFQPNAWGAVYGIQTHENIYELFYNVHVTRGLTLQPDFQFINRPGATTTFGDAAVFGLQFNAIL